MTDKDIQRINELYKKSKSPEGLTPEEKIEQAYLYDFYGELLNEHQRRIYEDFVFNDLSLGEIAAEEGISRQGVHDLVRRCDRTLQSYEERLHLIARFQKVKHTVEKIEQISTETQVRELAGQILEEL